MGHIESLDEARLNLNENKLYNLVGHAIEVTLKTGEVLRGFLEWHNGYLVNERVVSPDSVASIRDLDVKQSRVKH